MAEIKFTSAQLDRIKESDEFKKFYEQSQGGNDTTSLKELGAILDAYLADADNQAFWTETFAKDEQRRKEEMSTEDRDIDNAENDIASHLGAMYVETHPDENVSAETWDSEEYKKWEKDYIENNSKNGEDKELARLYDELEKAKQAKTAKLEQDRLDNIEKAENDLERYLGSMYVETHPDENVTAETWDSEEYKNWREGYLKNTEDKELLRLLAALEAARNAGKDDEQERKVQKEFESHEVDEETAARIAEFERMRDGLDDNEPEDDNTQKEEKTLEIDEPTDDNGGKTLSDEEYRERSANSDANAEAFNLLILDTLNEMKVISDDEFNNAKGSPEDTAVMAIRADMLESEKRTEFEVRFANKIASHPEVLDYAPPSILATSHNALKNFIDTTKKKSPKTDVSAYETRLGAINERIDVLSKALEEQNYLHFSDKTNIADTYQGYIDMFAARQKDLDPSDARIATMDDNRENLDKLIAKYDEMWNLTGLTEKDAGRINNRYDEAMKLVPDLQLSDDTLKLVSNFRFLDDKGTPIPQFIDPKDGSKHMNWSKGFEVDKEGRLAESIKRAANDEVLKTIGGKDDITKDALEQGLNDNLAIKLFTLHNAEEVLKGVASEEEKQKFTKPKYAQQFIKDLGNSEKPMLLSDEGYKTAIKWEMNQVDGYVHRLNKKIAPNGVSQVAEKIYADNANIDQFAKARVSKENLDDFRKRARKQLLKTGLNSFGMAAAFTVATKAIGSKFGTTAATATGIGVALGTTAYMVYKRKKQAKKNGQKYGWKEFRKDHALQIAVATSACAGAAAFCSMTGQSEMAATFGTAAIVIGSGGKGIDLYQQARAAGANQLESIAWGAGSALVTYGGAQMGRMAGTAAVNAINHAFQDNTIFQSKEEITKTETETKTETTYKDGAVAHAEKTINAWDSPEFKHNLEHSFANAENSAVLDGSHLDPNRVALMSHYLGLDGTVDVTQHVQGGPDIVTRNHTCFAGYDAFKAGLAGMDTTTDAFKALDSITPDMYQAMQNSVAPDGTVHLTPDAVKGFEILDNNAINTKGEISLPGHNGIDVQTDHVVGDNASQNPDGKYVLDKNGNAYTTWAGDGGATDTTTTTTTTTTTETQYTPNEGVTAIWGTITKQNPLKKLKERFGAFADKIRGKKTEEKPIDKQTGRNLPEDKNGILPGGKTGGGKDNPNDKNGIAPGGALPPENTSNPNTPPEGKLDLSKINGDNVAGMDYEVPGHEFANLDGKDENIQTLESGTRVDQYGRIVRRKSVSKEDSQEKPVSQEAIPDKEHKLENGFNEAASKSENETVKKSKWRNIPLATSFKKMKEAATNKINALKEEKAARKAEKQERKEKEQRQQERDERRAAGRRNATPDAEFIGVDGSEMPNFQSKGTTASLKPNGKTTENQPKKLTQEQISQNLYKNIDRLS